MTMFVCHSTLFTYSPRRPPLSALMPVGWSEPTDSPPMIPYHMPMLTRGETRETKETANVQSFAGTDPLGAKSVCPLLLGAEMGSKHSDAESRYGRCVSLNAAQLPLSGA